MKARIWVSVPDEVDGYYVEIRTQLTPKDKDYTLIIDSTWKRTVEDCRVWAMIQGVLPVNIEEFQS